MTNKLYFGTPWASSEYLWTAHSYLTNAKDLLEKRGQVEQAKEVGELIARVVKLADGMEEETEAEHQLDVSCIVNAGCN